MNKILNWLRVEPENNRLVKSIYFAFFTNGIMSIMLGTLLPYIRDENTFSYAESGLILSFHQLGNFGAVLAAGFLPYALGRKKSTLLLGAGLWAGLSLMVFSGNLWLFWVAFALTGIGRGTMSNICNAVISEVSKNKTGALNLLHAIFATGALLSPLIVFFHTKVLSGGWKAAALTAAALALAAWFLLAGGGLGNPVKKQGGESLMQFLKDTNLWVGIMILFFYLCAEASIIGWFVIYFRDTGLLPPLVAEFTPTLLWLMIMTGRLICVVVSSRINKNRLLLVLSLVVTFCFAGMLFSRSALLCVIFLLGLGLGMGGIYPTTFSTIKGTSSTLTTGFVIATASIGAIIMPGIVGAVANTHGLMGGVATVLVALSGIVILVLVRILMERREKQ